MFAAMRPASSILYVALLASSLYANKYVLSVLGFQYPMVFQGWQTLVGFVVFKAMAAWGLSSGIVTPMDKSGLISLFPNFVLFVVFIISGSKAVSTYPVIAFACAINVLPSLTFLVDSYATAGATPLNRPAGGNTALQKVCALLALPTAAAVVWATTHRLNGAGALIFDDMFWMAVHLGCGLALSFHSRIADQRFSYSERLFYSYVFALVVLAPASLYLEEAFEALNFKHRKQLTFLLGSVFSAGVGVALSLCQSKMKEDVMFGRLHHTGLAFAALLSVAFFETSLPWWGWVCAVINLSALVMVPSHIRPDEKIQANGGGGGSGTPHQAADGVATAIRRTTTSSSGIASSTKSVRIEMDQEDRVALLEPDEADLEVGRINERSADSKSS